MGSKLECWRGAETNILERGRGKGKDRGLSRKEIAMNRGESG